MLQKSVSRKPDLKLLIPWRIFLSWRDVHRSKFQKSDKFQVTPRNRSIRGVDGKNEKRGQPRWFWDKDFCSTRLHINFVRICLRTWTARNESTNEKTLGHIAIVAEGQLEISFATRSHVNSIDASRVFWINTKVCLWLVRCQTIGFYSCLIFANSWSDYVGVFRRPSGHLTYWPTYYRDKRYQDSRENRSVFR